MKRDCEQCGEPFVVKTKTMRFCSQNCRKRAWDVSHPATCPECGAPMWKLDRCHTQCRACYEAKRDAATAARDRQLEQLWAEGKRTPEIAEFFGWTRNRVSVEVAYARRRGADLPYRYTTGKRAGKVFA